MARNENKSIRIVAIGNSLTAGLTMDSDTPYSFKFAPYTEYLKKISIDFLKFKKAKIRIYIMNKGMCGDCTSDMLIRFDRDVVKKEPDYVIILGGTNDLGWGENPINVFDNLKKLYQRAESNNINPVACTIPSILGLDYLIPPRLELNELIKGEAEKRKMAFLDLFGATVDIKTNRLCDKYSSDGLHLSPEGYKKFGEIIFDEWLKNLLDQFN